ncbi:AzlC family ABC transporter permease [Fluviibacterium sp. DFM31]|uniref:AzlC family ABC transporter permease n=1 Tax=Meridianimarinicoccus marinus TaxID=3231483 RepID=A0ABV3L294_9RHOB
MTGSSANSSQGGVIAGNFGKGAVAGAPFLLVIIPFALLFGVVGTEAGLNLAQVMAFSMLVIAGAAQFTAVQLMVEDAPTVIALLTALAVNLRMAMYSASLVPYLGAAPLWQRLLISYGLIDQTYAVSIARYERPPAMTVKERVAYILGAFTMISIPWYGATLLGAVLGAAIPQGLPLDFALPITFLALIAPALKTLPHVVAALTSTGAALVFSWVPYSLGLIVAAVLAMAAGAVCEIWMERRA